MKIRLTRRCFLKAFGFTVGILGLSGASHLTFTQKQPIVNRGESELQVTTANTIELITHITGIINGVAFTAEGTGISMRGTGRATGVLKFSNEIPNFIPLLCRTWKCKHHDPIATAKGNENFFSKLLDKGDKIFTSILIEYPFGHDKILAASVCIRPEPNKQILHQTRLGTYSGPVDIIAQLPYDNYIYPAGPGKAIAKSERSVVRKDGTTIKIKYSEEIFFSPEFELSSRLVIRYSGAAIWSPNDLTLKLDTFVHQVDI